MTSCLDDDVVQALFARSNLPQATWPRYAKMLDDMHVDGGPRVQDARAISLVGLWKTPDGESLGSEDVLLCVFSGVGLVFLRKGSL